ncbi:conserved hypothetical protein [Ricinus communis]|uniref:NB-ARC domain-containing protein n=1 Tax=Ricinus communis TaxID=3988 RepID=B9T1X7_RICCO|nr:conserved hypothetical protein [Ricinus communis]
MLHVAHHQDQDGFLHNITRPVKKLKTKQQNTWHDPRVHSLFIEESELIGVESSKAKLISKLVEGASENAAISVVGMGGIGKTTLAKKGYD